MAQLLHRVDFTQHLAKFSQVIHFAGAGAHHANGVAE